MRERGEGIANQHSNQKKPQYSGGKKIKEFGEGERGPKGKKKLNAEHRERGELVREEDSIENAFHG